MKFKQIVSMFIVLSFFIYYAVMYSAFDHIPSGNEGLGSPNPNQINNANTSSPSSFSSLEANSTINKAMKTVESITKVILLIIVFGLVFMQLVLVLLAK